MIMEEWSREVRTTFDSDELDAFFDKFDPLELEPLLTALPDPEPEAINSEA